MLLCINYIFFLQLKPNMLLIITYGFYWGSMQSVMYLINKVGRCILDCFKKCCRTFNIILHTKLSKLMKSSIKTRYPSLKFIIKTIQRYLHLTPVQSTSYFPFYSTSKGKLSTFRVPFTILKQNSFVINKVLTTLIKTEDSYLAWQTLSTRYLHSCYEHFP